MVFQHCLNDCHGVFISRNTLLDTNDASDILDSLWASASIPASNPNAQNSDHDTSSTSSIDSMNIVNASSTIDPDLSSSNSDSDTPFF